MTRPTLPFILTVGAVLASIGIAGTLLWLQNDPRLADVEFENLSAPVSVIETTVTTDSAALDVPEDTAALVDATAEIDVVETDEPVTVESDVNTASSVSEIPPEAVTEAAMQPTTDSNESPADTTESSEEVEVPTVTVSALGDGVKELCFVPLSETATVQKVMLAASAQCGFSYSGKKQGNLGFFVEEISGLKQSVKNGQYWVFSVNGEKSQLGVSTRTVEPDDTIQWMYEAEY